jgi:hypothetical protein
MKLLIAEVSLATYYLLSHSAQMLSLASDTQVSRLHRNVKNSDLCRLRKVRLEPPPFLVGGSKNESQS